MPHRPHPVGPARCRRRVEYGAIRASGIHIRSSTPKSLLTTSSPEMSSGDSKIPSVTLSPTAKSSRSAGVAIMTACILPLYVNAIAISSGMSR
jgi:hypothetical protein